MIKSLFIGLAWTDLAAEDDKIVYTQYHSDKPDSSDAIHSLDRFSIIVAATLVAGEEIYEKLIDKQSTLRGEGQSLTLTRDIKSTIQTRHQGGR